MIKIAGRRLPPEIREALAAQSPPPEAVLLATVDEANYPHFALLSYREMLTVDGQPHLFLYGDSRTVGFLTRDRRCTLAFAGKRGVFYVKGNAFERLRVESLIVFRIEVHEVEQDLPGPGEEDAAVVSGIEFHQSEADLARREQLREHMRRLVRASGD
jgi:hypothetical protein